MKRKTKKRLVRIFTALLILAVLSGGGAYFYLNRAPDPVETVYAGNYCWEYSGTRLVLEGMVNSDAAQLVTMEKGLTVEEFFVKKGDAVHAGDPLFRYDATLETLDAELKRAELIELEYDLMDYYAQYKKYAKKDWEDPLIRELPEFVPNQPLSGRHAAPASVRLAHAKTPLFAANGNIVINTPTARGLSAEELTGYLKNAATVQNRTLTLVAYCKDGYIITWNFVNKTEDTVSVVPGNDELRDPDDKVTELFEYTDPTATLSVNGISEEYIRALLKDSKARQGSGYTKKFSLKFKRDTKDYYVTVTLNVLNVTPTPTPKGPTPPPTPPPHFGGGLTKEEREERIAEIAAKIRESELQHRQLELDLRNFALSGKDGYVYATVDGVVTTLNDPEEVRENETLLVVKGNGSFYVRGRVSEYRLSEVAPGTRFSGFCYENGAPFTGTVTLIESMPDGERGYSSADESYYGVRVTIDDPDGLEVGSWCELSAMDEQQPEGVSGPKDLCLYEAFIANENGEKCIYIARDGKLVREVVKTGKTMFGYVQLEKSTLTTTDRIAFPGGKGVKDGAPCVMDED